MTERDQQFMQRALDLAGLGMYTTSPNPRVGCVIVNGDTVVGEGYHQKAGGPHAEVHALQMAGTKTIGSTVYVTLEPCAHSGRTPPCVNALLQARPARVVIAMIDPNPSTTGQGVDQLRAAGIEVEVGVLERQARELNIGFISLMTRDRPWVRLKVAASLDGRTALAGGESQWITGEAARQDGHRWRARACAILTGLGTIKHDNPQLTAREVMTDRQPLRVVVDSRLQIPLDARVLGPGCLVAAAGVDVHRTVAIRALGAEVMVMPAQNGQVDVLAILQELARRGCNEVHVEAGYRLNGSLLAAGVVDELLIYFAPCVLGDTAHGMFQLPPLMELSARQQFKIEDVQKIGEDLRILARI